MSLTKKEIQELEIIQKISRALDGKPIEPSDMISKLTNVKNILERSDFPTYPLLQEQIYCRLVSAKYGLTIFKKYAETKAEALISYKRQSRKENVEMTKRLASPEQMLVFGDQTPQLPQPKKRFWQRGKKKEETEFVQQ